MEKSENIIVQPILISDVVKAFWDKRISVVSIFLVVLLVTAIWVHNADRMYRASIVLSPPNALTNSEGAGLGQLSAVAGLAGLNLGGGNSPYFGKHLALLRSPELARRLDQKYNLRKILFSSLWNENNQSWQEPSGLFYSMKRIVKSILGYSSWVAPDEITLQAALSGRLTVIDHSLGTELKRVEFSYGDPAVAKNILQWMVDEANLIIREKNFEEVNRQIAFLTERLENVRNEEHRDAIVSILIEQERALLLMDSVNGAGAAIFDPAIVETVPFFPKVTMTFVLAIFLGFVISVVYVYISVVNSTNKKSQ